uniref:Uncharacterized protein n=1 Tax=Ixodes scapularis TaxID=6945 RepID=A0A4D5RCG8_IXOSC
MCFSLVRTCFVAMLGCASQLVKTVPLFYSPAPPPLRTLLYAKPINVALPFYLHAAHFLTGARLFLLLFVVMRCASYVQLIYTMLHFGSCCFFLKSPIADLPKIPSIFLGDRQ